MVAGVGAVRVGRDGLPVAQLRPRGVLAHGFEEGAEADQGVGAAAARRLHRPAVLLLCEVRAAVPPAQHQAQVVARQGVVRVELEGAAEERLGAGAVLARRFERAEAHQRVAVVRVQGDGLRVAPLRPGAVAPRVLEEPAEVVVGVGAARVEREGRAELRLGAVGVLAQEVQEVAQVSPRHDVGRVQRHGPLVAPEAGAGSAPGA